MEVIIDWAKLEKPIPGKYRIECEIQDWFFGLKETKTIPQAFTYHEAKNFLRGLENGDAFDGKRFVHVQDFNDYSYKFSSNRTREFYIFKLTKIEE